MDVENEIERLTVSRRGLLVKGGAAAAGLSGLSALASGTDVAITCAPAAIAALIPATCLATSLFA